MAATTYVRIYARVCVHLGCVWKFFATFQSCYNPLSLAVCVVATGDNQGRGI